MSERPTIEDLQRSIDKIRAERSNIRQKTEVGWFGFWAGAFIFICFLNFISDANGMNALDAIMQAINPAWVPLE